MRSWWGAGGDIGSGPRPHRHCADHRRARHSATGPGSRPWVPSRRQLQASHDRQPIRRDPKARHHDSPAGRKRIRRPGLPPLVAVNYDRQLGLYAPILAFCPCPTKEKTLSTHIGYPEDIMRVTRTSEKSFEDAAVAALGELPPQGRHARCARRADRGTADREWRCRRVPAVHSHRY